MGWRNLPVCTWTHLHVILVKRAHSGVFPSGRDQSSRFPSQASVVPALVWWSLRLLAELFG